MYILHMCVYIHTYIIHTEKAMAPHSSTLAWKIPWMEEPDGLQSMGSLRVQHDWANFTSLHFHALEKEMAIHSSVLAWRFLGMGEPGGLPSMGSHRVRHDWSDLAAAACSIWSLDYSDIGIYGMDTMESSMLCMPEVFFSLLLSKVSFHICITGHSTIPQKKDIWIVSKLGQLWMRLL